MLRPAPDDSDDDEPLEQGFYRKEDYKALDTDFDVRNILPESLERLDLHGTFHNEGEYEWRAMERVFAVPNPATPHLTMENTSIRRTWNNETREQIGTAEEPVSMYEHPLLSTLFDGHGYGAF
jgi:hypothetical protein